MKLNPAYVFVGAATVALGAWFYIGTSGAGDDGGIYADVEARQEQTAPAPTVVIRSVSAQPHTVTLSTYGNTQPNRRVDVKAKTAGSVAATPVREGARVARGDLICRQDVDAREAIVEQARAQLAKAESDLRATTTLVEKGYRSPAQLNGERAAVDAAKAQLKQAEIELGNVVLRAPFSGIYVERMAEVGDYLAPGQPCGRIVDLNPLKLDVQLSETQVGKVGEGQEVEVRLATGETVTGKIAFIQSVANPQTRTFRTEMHLPNPDLSLKAGVSATVSMAIGEVDAHLVPASIMALGDDGETGIRYVDADNRVRFAATRQVDETDQGLWVTGLPQTARIIIEGQDFVSVGSDVRPVYEGESTRNTAPVAGLSANAELD